MKLLMKGGTIVTGQDCHKADLLIEGERLAAVGADLSADGATVVDVAGRLLFPGFIDAHTHFDLAVAGTVTADDFSSGTQAALIGGTTTIIDFATQYKGESLKTALANWHRKAEGRSSCDYGFHLAISDWQPQVSDELAEIVDQGVTTFKLYMTYDSVKVSDQEIFQILRRLKAIGAIAGVHCENSGIIAALVEEHKQRGQFGVSSHPATRPAVAEAEAVNRLLCIAELVDTPVIVVHLSSAEGLQAVDLARERGQTVYVETCPQYLLLDDSRYDLPGFEGAKYVIAPPLRQKKDQESLWQAVADGRIQTLATDHCSFTTAQKALGQADFTRIPGGMPGVETRAVLLYTNGVRSGRITLPQLCRLLSENPARLYGLYPRKGCLAPGSDADIVVFDPAGEGTIHAAGQFQRSDYTPFEHFPTAGRIEQVYLRGRLVVDQHHIKHMNTGCYLPRQRFDL